MKATDRILQRWRIAKAAKWIPKGARVLDVGCADGALFRQLRHRLAPGGIGIDHDLAQRTEAYGAVLYPGIFPADLPPAAGIFDAITMLAVLEHVPTDAQPALANACREHLAPGGRLIISVPSALVDPILDALKAVRIIDGMELEEHYGFEVGSTPAIFEPAGFRLLLRRRFQLGLNNLFVFEKPWH